MIIKNGKTISSVIKGSQVIDKIYKGTLIVYESWEELIANGVPPLTFYSKGVDLVDYKLYGNSVQDSGNLFDINTMSERIYAYITPAFNWNYSDDSYSIRVPVKPNTTYIVSTDNQIEIFRIGCAEFEDIPDTVGSLFPLMNVIRQTDNTPIRITTTDNTIYLVIQTTAVTMEETLKTLKVEQINPTPNAPIEIESVGVRTKNLFNINNFNSSRITVSSDNAVVNVYEGNSSQSTGATLQELCPTIGVGKIYYLYYTSDTDNTRFSIGTYAEANFWENGKSKTITENDLTTIVRIGGGTSAESRKINLSKIQVVEIGEVATGYEPYGYKIPVVARGKNLINVPIVEEQTLGGVTFSIDENGLIHLNGTVTKTAVWGMSLGQTFNNSNFTTIIESGSVTGLNSTIYLKTSGGEYITNYFIDGNTHSTNGEASFSNLYMTVRVGDVFNNLVFGVMLTEDENVTDYEPYVEPIITNIYLNEPLRKIGDYADYIDFEKTQVVRNVGIQELDGVTTGKMLKSYSRGGYITINDMKIPTNTGEGMGFSSFTKTSTYLENEGIVFGWGNKNAYFCYINGSTDYTVINTLINELYVSGVDTNIYYQLETPIEETIELPNMPTIKGTTILEVDTKIQPSNLEVVYKGKQVK